MPAHHYEIRVRGAVPAEDTEELGDLHVVVQPTQTVLRGRIVDQAALQGVLARLQALGLELVEVRRLPDADP